MDVVIRAEHSNDVKCISRVVAAAFATAAHSSGTEPAIVEQLRNDRALTVSLVAEREGNLVGHVAASPVETTGGNHNWYGIGPIAVAPEYQRRGIGTRLMKQVLHDLKQMSAAGCVLLGEPEFYARFGFATVTGLTLPGVPDEYFLAIKFGDTFAQGVVTYHPAFGG